MRLGIIGTGYVGLVSGTCLAELGNTVICLDKDKKKIEALEKGKIPIYEPGLDELVAKNVKEKRLSFTTDTKKAVSGMDAVFIAVGTPSSRRGDGYADLTYVYEAAREIAPFITGYTVIVDKSTVPVGTAKQVKRIIKEANKKAKFDVVSNPEFLREGAAIDDFMRPDRVVIGVENKKAEKVMREIYKPLYLIETPMVVTTPQTSELIKYASNAFLATKVSFINEMANLCESIDGNVIDLAKGMGLDKRIGPKFLHPGPGYGGSCFPKDTHALTRIAQEHGAPSRIVETVIEVNSAQKARMVKKIKQALQGEESGKTIAVLGLSFKPETDDMREAQSITILSALIEKGARIKAHDPEALKMAREIMPEIHGASSPYEAVEKADCLILMTEWNEYRSLDFAKIKKLMKKPVFVDLRNVYEPKTLKDAGFEYYGVGRN
ncbi:MAG: UDP-glucose dehydrogenase family protein [Patescibacteria group bacterium]